MSANAGSHRPTSRALGGEVRNVPSLPEWGDVGVTHRFPHQQHSRGDRAVSGRDGERDGEPVLAESRETEVWGKRLFTELAL